MRVTLPDGRVVNVQTDDPAVAERAAQRFLDRERPERLLQSVNPGGPLFDPLSAAERRRVGEFGRGVVSAAKAAPSALLRAAEATPAALRRLPQRAAEAVQGAPAAIGRRAREIEPLSLLRNAGMAALGNIPMVAQVQAAQSIQQPFADYEAARRANDPDASLAARGATIATMLAPRGFRAPMRRAGSVSLADEAAAAPRQRPNLLRAAGAPVAVGGGAALALGAGEAEAQEQEETPLEQERRRLADLEAELELFKNPRTDEEVMDVQTRLRGATLYDGPIDADWGGATKRAAKQYVPQLEERIRQSRARFTELEQADAARRLTPDPGAEAVRHLAPIALPIAASLLLGPASRFGATRVSRSEMAKKASQANALLTPRAPPQTRFANLNAFAQLGGARGRVPFMAAETERGFRRRPRAAEPSTYFPERGQVRPADLAFTAPFALESGYAFTQWLGARQRLADREAAYTNDKSEVNLRRLEQARTDEAIWNTAWRTGAGVAAGHFLSAGKIKHANVRPNVPQAEQMISQLNRLLARDRAAARARSAGKRTPPPAPQPTRRRRSKT